MNRQEKLDLLNRAKDAYYNSDEELLSDAEYDKLESELGLENNNYIGSKAGNYNVEHSFIMGSLAKTQVHENKQGEINWDECVSTINNAMSKANGCSYIELTPKLDGASFSVEFKNINNKAKLISVATRGNGNYGTSIKHWFKPILNTDYWSKINDAVIDLCENNSDDIFCIRGEVLVRQDVFSKKYTEQYVNPRAFTSGMLGIKYSDATSEKLQQGQDLHFVCYDYRLFHNKTYQELSWMNPDDISYSRLKNYLRHIGELPDVKYCICLKGRSISVDELKELYNYYDEYRNNESQYALDGIVFKPNCSARKYNSNRPRPVDCIALKFMPMINSTTITNIEWQVKKTGEYFPTAIVEPIIMPDGKKITRASLHNYNYITKNEVGIGSKVRISLAGDIIPYVYEILSHVDVSDNKVINLPSDGYVESDANSGALHYMKKFTENEEEKNSFLSSCIVLNINNIGPAAANMLYDTMHAEVDNLINVIYLMNDDCYKLIYDKLGDARSIQNIVNSLKQFATAITITDIIKSFCFKSCGTKASEVCARIMSNLSYDTASLPEISYSWALNKSSRNYYLVSNAIEMLDVEYLEEDETNKAEQIPVIMTGSPEDITEYKTKDQWLQAHSKLRNTTSWKEVQILFTDNMDSNTGKMQKARKLGIEIRTYDNADDFLTECLHRKPDESKFKEDFNMLF